MIENHLAFICCFDTADVYLIGVWSFSLVETWQLNRWVGVQTDHSSFLWCHTWGILHVAFLIMIHIFFELSFDYQKDYEVWYPIGELAWSLEQAANFGNEWRGIPP